MSDLAARILPEKPAARLRIYAWAPKYPTPEYDGLIKIGQTTREDVNERIRESQGQMQQDYSLLGEFVAEREDGTNFRDTDVIERLVAKGFENPKIGSSREWVRCSSVDFLQAIAEIQKGEVFSGHRYQTFPMRTEQRQAVDKTAAYFRDFWENEGKATTPRFLWNAKMRFGKTFTAYQLAKELDCKRILILTFKPAVGDAWQADLEEHIDFEGWTYYPAKRKGQPPAVDADEPLVCFGSFQDLMGKDKNTGTIKSKNEWIHTTNWDLVIFDEYHFGAWRESAKALFEGEDASERNAEIHEAFNTHLDTFDEELGELSSDESDFLPITTRAYLYLSGTPFRAIATGEFIEEQIFNWTYTDEQRAKQQFALYHPGQWNPYAALPEMRIFTYQMPDDIVSIAQQGEFDEFDLNAFFKAEGRGSEARFVHQDYVQRWLDLIRGKHRPSQVDNLKTGSTPPFPYSDGRLLPYLQHSFWFLPDVAACHAMKKLLAAPHNDYWHHYRVIVAAGEEAGTGQAALAPVRQAVKDGHDTKTITLSCGKLTTGVTVKQWSAILMLRNLSSPETYFQAAFRVQSPWSIRNPHGTNPDEEQVLKPAAFVFDFAPTRALRQVADYGARLNPDADSPEVALQAMLAFLPVLAYDGSHMSEIDAEGILDYTMSGATATLLARKWESAVLVNVDNATLKKIMANDAAMAAIMKIEGFRSLGSKVFEKIVNTSEKVKATRKERGDRLTPKQKKRLSEQEKEYQDQRKEVRKKLIKFATRIPAFMYLTDFRENTLQDVITKLEPDLFKAITGLEVADFQLLVSLGVFNQHHMNQAVFAFRRYEDASLSYTGIDRRSGTNQIALFDTVIER